MALKWSTRRVTARAVVEWLSVGTLSGILAGLAAGLMARLAMRFVALVVDLLPAFTFAGTFNILAFGAVLGIAPGIIYAIVRPWLPGPSILKGATFSALLFVVLEVYPLIAQASFTEPGVAPASLRWGLFGAASVVYGLTLGVTEKLIGRWLLLPPEAG